MYTILLNFSGCDLNSARRPGPGGRGGDEAHDQASPLHLCCQWGLKTVVQTLVEHGAAINSKVSYAVPQQRCCGHSLYPFYLLIYLFDYLCTYLLIDLFIYLFI